MHAFNLYLGFMGTFPAVVDHGIRHGYYQADSDATSAAAAAVTGAASPSLTPLISHGTLVNMLEACLRAVAKVEVQCVSRPVRVKSLDGATFLLPQYV